MAFHMHYQLKQHYKFEKGSRKYITDLETNDIIQAFPREELYFRCEVIRLGNGFPNWGWEVNVAGMEAPAERR